MSAEQAWTESRFPRAFFGRRRRGRLEAELRQDCRAACGDGAQRRRKSNAETRAGPFSSNAVTGAGPFPSSDCKPQGPRL
mmetsp:Transcript_3180/g.7148  ORF Transcript_3180/g.7148 Transcript_3180/m.7148 type:complete len:80 (-) Transcript_3180:282-521(-)